MDNRTHILEQAMAIFADRGYDASGVQEICQAAHVTKPTLYHYFGSKRGLLEAVLDRFSHELESSVTQAAAQSQDLPLTMERLAAAFFDFARRHPQYYRMQLAMVFAPRDSEARQAVAERNQRIHDQVEAMFERASQYHGNMRGRQRFYAASYIGQLNTCIGLWLNGHLELDDALVQRVAKQFQHGIYS
ncbi:MAG: TetR/AcrR family transcriptional regulator [Anaerolineae bacterium]|jgi:TetR/AcrR family transcriptional regulator|nr:TetR/AcrR family transcriptional regulator [Anaerolineae bacterium]